MEFLHKILGTIHVSGIRRNGAYTVERHSDSGQSFLTAIMGYEPLRCFKKNTRCWTALKIMVTQTVTQRPQEHTDLLLSHLS